MCHIIKKQRKNIQNIRHRILEFRQLPYIHTINRMKDSSSYLSSEHSITLDFCRTFCTVYL